MIAAPPDCVLRPLAFADLPGWSEDDPSALIPGLRNCLRHVTTAKPYRTGSLGLTTGDLLPLLEAAAGFEPADAAEARAFFETRCRPFRIERPDAGRGFVTAFYEPEVAVSAVADAVWRFPFYRRPADLVDLDDRNRPATLDASYAFGRAAGQGEISAYPDRRAIDGGSLDGRGLEIAWAKSRVDVFFAHVQGAARLRYPDGTIRRITYAAKAGHPFSPVGRLLIDRGEIEAADISMQSIRAWLAAHADEADEVLWHNRSYIFFRDAEVDNIDAGPIAAAKVPLIAGRALAVDRGVHTFGFPFFIAAHGLERLAGGKPFRRLMLALDTGTAIVGPARGDIFTGSGDAAGEMAGAVRNDADFHVLIPTAAASRFG